MIDLTATQRLPDQQLNQAEATTRAQRAEARDATVAAARVDLPQGGATKAVPLSSDGHRDAASEQQEGRHLDVRA